MGSNVTENQIEDVLKTIDYPGLNRDILSFGFVKNTTIDQGTVEIEFEPSTDREDVIQQMVDEMREKINELEDVSSVNINFAGQASGENGQSDTKAESDGSGSGGTKVAAAAPGATTDPDSGPMNQEPIPGVDNIVAVASGKGGVGKSTVAVNLAASLREQGHSVGLGDMDIYGPSAPTMLGVKERPKINPDEQIIPPESRDIKCMSIGFIMDETDPVVWRGPMVMKAVTQFLRDVNWGDLDYLVLDLPPGTGDAQLTLMQKVPLSGAVIVTTPQDVALIDAQKSVEMFRKIDINIIGIVENMSVYICPECGHEEHIFGSGGGKKEALRLNVPFLGGIPLNPEVRAGGDSGDPIVFSHPEDEVANIFGDIAQNVTDNAESVEVVMDKLKNQSASVNE